MPTTIYRVQDERGTTYETHSTEHAARLSRAGLHVTATTEGDA